MIIDLVSTLSRAGAIGDAVGLSKDTCGQSRTIQHPWKVVSRNSTYSVLVSPRQSRTSASQKARQGFGRKANTNFGHCCAVDSTPLQPGRDKLGHPQLGLLETWIDSRRELKAYLAISRSLASKY